MVSAVKPGTTSPAGPTATSTGSADVSRSRATTFAASRVAAAAAGSAVERIRLPARRERRSRSRGGEVPGPHLVHGDADRDVVSAREVGRDRLELEPGARHVAQVDRAVQA